MKLKSLLQQRKILLAILIVIAGGIYFGTVETETSTTETSASSEETKAVSSSDTETTQTPGPAHKDAASSQVIEDDTASTSSSTSPTTYKEEMEKISKLSKQYPQTRSRLLEIIAKKDKFKDQKVEPHSVDEIRQNQIGALKVMALRAVMEKETDTHVLKQNMDYVIQNAQDPTIVKIASAALESINEGRPFFKDILDGIDNLDLD